MNGFDKGGQWICDVSMYCEMDSRLEVAIQRLCVHVVVVTVVSTTPPVHNTSVLTTTNEYI